MKWFLSILFVLLNYLFIFFAVPFVYKFFFERLSIINISDIFIIVHFLDVLFVLFLYAIFYKYYRQSVSERNNDKNIEFLYLVIIVMLPTIVFLLYKYLVGEINYNDFNVKEFFLYQLAYITFIPFTEEILFREILYKILIKYNIFVVSIFISILFTVIHIGVGEFDLIYLLYIFLNGVVLFYVRYKKNLYYVIASHAMINMIVIFFT